jgi:hydroxymethylbilane synthase
MRKIIVGSRRSKLALTQTNWVIDQLKAIDPAYDFEVKEIVTKGD